MSEERIRVLSNTLGLTMSNPTRDNLKPWLGRPCLVSGVIENWHQNDEKRDFGVCLLTCEINGYDWTTSADHLWIYFNLDLWRRKKKSFGGMSTGRAVSYLGRVSNYCRANGSSDIGVSNDPKLVRLSRYLERRDKMSIQGRWALHQEGLIVSDHQPNEGNTLADFRLIIERDKKEVEQGILRLSTGFGIDKSNPVELKVKTPARHDVRGFSKRSDD